MAWMRLAFRRIYGFLRKGHIESEMDEELRFHIHMRTQENIRGGMTPNQARREAERRFGNFEHIKDLCRDVRGGGMLDTFWQDVRFGIRMLIKSRAVTFVAVLALALGIGANTAIFSVVNSVLLRPLPYKEPDRLVMVWVKNDRLQSEYPASAADFVDWRERNQVFDQVAAFQSQPFNLTDGSEAERVGGVRASASLFPLLGVEPAQGRTFAPEEDQPGNNRVVVISHGLWHRRFGSDPDLAGKTITLNDQDYTVIGVMPEGFQFPRRGEMPEGFQFAKQPELWTPLALSPDQMTNRGRQYLAVIARLKPTVTIEQAQSALRHE